MRVDEGVRKNVVLRFHGGLRIESANPRRRRTPDSRKPRAFSSYRLRPAASRLLETKVTLTAALSGDLHFLHYSTALLANRAFLLVLGVCLSTRFINTHGRSLHVYYCVCVVYRTHNRTNCHRLE